MNALEKAIADARARRGWSTAPPKTTTAVNSDIDDDEDSLYDKDPPALASALRDAARRNAGK